MQGFPGMTLVYQIRKPMLFFTVLLFFFADGFGDEALPQLTFTSETGLAFVYGKAEEIVFKSANGTDLLSLLVYPIPPGLGAYAGMEANWRDSVLARIRLGTAWPLTSGNLTDDDWINVSSFYNEPDIHSDSTAYMTGWYHADFMLGVFDRSNFSKIETLVGMTSRQMHWEGWDARQEATAPGYSSGTYKGQVLDYRQTWFIPWFGFAVKSEKEHSIVDFSLRLSPWMRVEGRDIHLLTGRTYVDVMHGGVLLAAGLGASRRLTGLVWLTGSFSAELARNVRGNTYEYENGTLNTNTYLNMAGAALTMLSCYMGISIHP
jgi:outer membrane protease